VTSWPCPLRISAICRPPGATDGWPLTIRTAIPTMRPTVTATRVPAIVASPSSRPTAKLPAMAKMATWWMRFMSSREMTVTTATSNAGYGGIAGASVPIAIGSNACCTRSGAIERTQPPRSAATAAASAAATSSSIVVRIRPRIIKMTTSTGGKAMPASSAAPSSNPMSAGGMRPPRSLRSWASPPKLPSANTARMTIAVHSDNQSSNRRPSIGRRVRRGSGGSSIGMSPIATVRFAASVSVIVVDRSMSGRPKHRLPDVSSWRLIPT
jgi:hypothetical protein